MFKLYYNKYYAYIKVADFMNNNSYNHQYLLLHYGL